MGVGENVKTYFYGNPIETYSLLEAVEITLPQSPQLPLVLSVSYGGGENVCSGSGSLLCYNKDTEDYIERADSEFQKLAVMGTSVIVSSGDSGPIFYPSCLLNTSVYCPGGGCQYSQSKCQQMWVTIRNSGQGFMWPGGGFALPTVRNPAILCVFYFFETFALKHLEQKEHCSKILLQCHSQHLPVRFGCRRETTLFLLCL